MMNFRLKTSKETEEILRTLQSSLGLTWNVLSRLAVSLSLNDPSSPPEVTDTSGIEINRNTMTGEHDYVYKALIRQHAGCHLSDEEFFPDYFNRHLSRGIVLLEGEYRLAGNFEKLFTKFFSEGK